MFRLAAAAAALLASISASAQFVSAAPDQVELTVYRERTVLTSELSLDAESGGLAMVTETRTVDIPAGISTLRFRGVADAIVPQTAKMEGLPATVIETNFDYNLLTPGSLIESSVGRRVRLIRTERMTGKVTEHQGILVSGPTGVVIDFGGGFEALNCSGYAERLVFEDVPTNLADVPTLSMIVSAATAGRYVVQLSYLALGLDWSADYVARIHPDGKRLDLLGWLTLVNRHGTHFVDAKTHVVAGRLSRTEEETQASDRELASWTDACWPIGQFRRVLPLLNPAAPAPMFNRSFANAALEEIAVTGQRVAQASQLGDYKLYTVPFATTVAPRQIKQVRLLEQQNVGFERVYEYRVEEESLGEESSNDRPRVMLKLQNEKRNGLGVALPGGTVSVMERSTDDREVLAGEHTLSDTPVGLPVEIYYGRALDVWVTPRIVEEEEIEDEEQDRVRATIEVEIGNDKPVPIALQIVQPRGERENFRVVKENRRHALKAGDPLWSIRLKPGQREVLRYTIEAAE